MGRTVAGFGAELRSSSTRLSRAPANLPVEQPTKLDLALDLKTAKTLGLTISRVLLQRADKVIE